MPNLRSSSPILSPVGKRIHSYPYNSFCFLGEKSLKKQEGPCAYPPATTNPLLHTCATEQRPSWVTCPALSLPLQLLMKASGKELTSECDLPLNLWSPVTFDWHASPYLAFGTLLKFNWFWTEPSSPLCSANRSTPQSVVSTSLEGLAHFGIHFEVALQPQFSDGFKAVTFPQAFSHC